MSGATDHEIYKQRGKMNMQIGLVLAGFVILVMIATIAKLSGGMQESAEAQVQVESASE